MKEHDLKPRLEQPRVRLSRRARLQALLFAGAAAATALLMAGGGLPKLPPDAGE